MGGGIVNGVEFGGLTGDMTGYDGNRGGSLNDNGAGSMNGNGVVGRLSMTAGSNNGGGVMNGGYGAFRGMNTVFNTSKLHVLHLYTNVHI